MSMQEESIYDLIPKEVAQKKKPPRYKSKFNPKIPPSYSTFGQAGGAQIATHNVGGHFNPPDPSHKVLQSGATFGTATKHVSDFQKYKTRKSSELPAPKKFNYTDRRKEKLNARLEKEKIPKRGKKNFIKKNAIDAILKSTKKKNKQEMRYVEKPEYGKVPEYLREVKSDIEKEKQFIEQMLEKSKAASETEQKSRVMDESEKEELLDALKLKWQDVNEKYQKISHIVNHDTIGKKLRKEQYEAEMDELEAAIRKLSKGTVLISDD